MCESMRQTRLTTTTRLLPWERSRYRSPYALKQNAASISDAWGQHLHQFRWSHWVTLTPRSQTHSADALWTAFRDGFVRRVAWYARGSTPWVAAMERGNGGLLHLHALVANTESVACEVVKDAWTLGLQRVDRYDPNGRAAWYLSKELYLPDGTWPRFHCSRLMPPDRRIAVA
jgi:hypothetical protein